MATLSLPAHEVHQFLDNDEGLDEFDDLLIPSIYDLMPAVSISNNDKDFSKLLEEFEPKGS